MEYEELVEKYMNEGYSREEAESKAKEDLEEEEHLDWYRFNEICNRRF